jgi:SAM-dependent methyltransferase
MARIGTTLEHEDGSVRIDERAGEGKTRAIAVTLRGETTSPSLDIETAYTPELIASVLEVKGPAWLCDEIRRDEDPTYVSRFLAESILSYVPPESTSGRLLELGSGGGASSLNLRRLLPEVKVVGVELLADHVQLARDRAAYYTMDELEFIHNPDGSRLPDSLGEFEYVMLSAVYEHLLPAERRSLMPQIWSHLKPGGLLFINQLPHRFSPLETHTTGLPLINYLPDGLAYRASRRFSSWVAADQSWESLLRAGIRGGTVREILRDIGSERAEVLEPTLRGKRDQIDLWFALSGASRWPLAKRIARGVMKGLKRATGITFVPELSLAIRKRS